jgi:divalent metal cation (Fe/Co/Zn/Cd) transporter
MKEARQEGLKFFAYLRESKDPTAKTVIFEDSAALLGIVIAAVGIYLTEHQAGPGNGAYWDGMASIVIGLVLAVVAFALARTSRALLLGEAASAKVREKITKAIESHPNVVKVVELLTMHLSPKQILINAHVNLRDDLVTAEIERTNEEIESLIKSAEPKVEMIFLETARASHSLKRDVVPEHIG